MEEANRVPIELAVAIPTFIGSLLSFLATSIAIVFHIISPPSRHFRHALIINLLVADFINSLDNTISGAIYLNLGYTGSPQMPASPACIANGWFGQLSVQTVDFTILIISISVLQIVLSKSPAQQPSLLATVLTCAAAWVPGLITSNVALGFNMYGHVSGNWCWIKPDLRFRYGLTHGWRIAIFLATIGIYTAIYIHLKRVFNRVRMSNATSETKSKDRDNGGSSRWARPIAGKSAYQQQQQPGQDIPMRPTNVKFNQNRDLEDVDMVDNASTQHLAAGTERASDEERGRVPQASEAKSKAGRNSIRLSTTASRMPAPPNLKRMLLMNGYPIAYIILWIPGMANRLVEVINGSSPVWLRALQASTQFVGFANAVTYGLNEQARGSLGAWWRKWI